MMILYKAEADFEFANFKVLCQSRLGHKIIQEEAMHLVVRILKNPEIANIPLQELHIP